MLIIHGHNRVFHTVSGNLSRYGAFVLPRIRIKRAINQVVAFLSIVMPLMPDLPRQLTN